MHDAPSSLRAAETMLAAALSHADRATRVLFLSPHFDDVAFSCGATVAKAGASAVCATVFTSGPAEGHVLSAFAGRASGGRTPDGILAIRREEEARALAAMGVAGTSLGFTDAVFRGVPDALYTSGPALTQPRHPNDDPTLASRIADRARALVEEMGGTENVLVCGPLGIGTHVDHVLVYEATRLLGERGVATLHYEDFPYADMEWRYTAKDKGDPVERRLVDVLDQRVSATSPVYADVDTTFEARIASTLAYTTQVPHLLGTEDEARACLTRYAESIAKTRRETTGTGSARLVERFWHLHA